MRPGPALVGALLAWAVLGAAMAWLPLPVRAWGAAGLALALLATLDGWRLLRMASPTVEREVPGIVPVGVEREVALRVRAADDVPVTLWLHDRVPGDWPQDGLPRRVRVPPAADGEVRVVYRLRPTARGPFVIDGCHARLRSPLGLWWQARVLGTAQAIRVYPNFAPLARLAMVSAEQASRVVGAHVRRLRGEGTDFRQLRDYRVGDSLRQIDWKASRRTLRLISREYQSERNQQVLLVIDTGRRMLARDDALSHFDHALDASLVLAYLALRQGDAVGMLASGGQGRWIAPARGMGTLDVLLNALYDLEASPVATDYLAAAAELGRLQSRRALVLLVTNVRDEDIEDLLVAVHQLQRRHLVCVASLREAALDAAIDAPVARLDDAVGAGALLHYLEQRRRAHEALRARGATVLDVTSKQLPQALVDAYLAAKRGGVL
jgi:uncharacterized protein (DUF58 family)